MFLRRDEPLLFIFRASLVLRFFYLALLVGGTGIMYIHHTDLCTPIDAWYSNSRFYNKRFAEFVSDLFCDMSTMVENRFHPSICVGFYGSIVIGEAGYLYVGEQGPNPEDDILLYYPWYQVFLIILLMLYLFFVFHLKY
jgi:hypothetical protein